MATLERLVADLGGGVLEVAAAPHGLDVHLAQAAIHDPTDDLDVERGEVVLAVGVTIESAATLVERAGRSGAAAVLTKLDPRDSSLVELAATAGVALVWVAREITWSQLHGLVRNSIVSAGQGGPSEFGVPVGDLFSLANAVAAMVGGPTTIEDPQSRVLAYSSNDQSVDEGRRQTILGRQVPDAYLRRLNERGVFRRLWSAQEVVRVDDLEDPDGPAIRPRLAVAIRAGDEILGSIWVAEADAPLGEEAEEALLQASHIAALHLVRHRSGEALERRMRGEVLRSLLEGRAAATAVADRLDLDAAGSCFIVAFELQSVQDAELALQRSRAIDLITLHCEAFRRRSVLAAVGRTVYALLPTGASESDGGVHRLARDVIGRSGNALSVQLHVGISAIVSDLRQVPRAREEVDQVLRVLAERPAGSHVTTFGDVRPEVLLLDLRDHVAGRAHLITGPVGRLRDADGDDGTSVATLGALFDSFGDVPAAARAMQVHPNTFRYRLKRLEELAGLDLADPVQRLAAELELRLT